MAMQFISQPLQQPGSRRSFGMRRRVDALTHAIAQRWREDRMLATLDAIPGDISKDIGYPTMERLDDR